MIIKKTIFTILVILIMASCTSDDSNKIEENNLNNLQFEVVANFDPNFLEGISMGITNSASENSIYISSRDDYPLVTGTNREQIIKLNLDNGNIIEKQYSNSDFITKRLLISENQLISIGGQFVNTYELDIINDPTTENHQRFLSHFTIANENNTTYIIGGDLTGNNSNKIYEWNPNNPQNFIEFTTLPEPRYGAGSAIINDKLYIFGGSTDNSLENSTDKIYVIPLGSPNVIQELSMNIALSETFVHKYNDNIIVCGETNDGHSIIGIFDTVSEQFEILEHNLSDINADYKIGQMTILNNKLYLVYGFVEPLDPPGTGLNSEWTILSAQLN
jgi:hypothetical protein